MEVDSPFPKFAKGKRLNISPIAKRLFVNDVDDDDDSSNGFSERLAAVQRRLSFDNDHSENSMILDDNISDDASGESNTHLYDIDPSKTMDSVSPPYKKAKSQIMFDSSTPFNGRTTPPSNNTSLLSAATTPLVNYRRTKLQTSLINSSNVITRLNAAPVNPFTPTGRIIVMENQKRKQKHKKAFQEWLSGSAGDDSLQNSSKSESDCEFDDKSIVGTSLSDLETSRFAEEFKVDSLIAGGTFGRVFKCTNYLDGMEYAIKKSVRQVAGTKYERYARKEVFAHAALKFHSHVVTYYSSWIEDGHLFIQTEYCNGGSLDTLINIDEKVFTEGGLRRLVNHVAKGLKHMHSLRLAHMDLKPSNILVNKITSVLSSDEELEEVDRDDIDIVYKIGDLGHVVVFDEQVDVEDGDCRYLPKELLNENFECLQKADVFAFGMTLYEAAGGGPLPKHGRKWQQLRSGDIPYLIKYSSAFNQIIRSMLHPEPEKRPDVRCILQKTRVVSGELQQQLFSWKVKSDFYTQHVKAKLSFIDNNHSPVICPDNIPKIFIEEA